MEKVEFCQSCGIPLSSPVAGECKGNYCGNCTDETGALHPKDAIQAGLAHWLQSFSAGVSIDECMKRASSYMAAMPAWAGK